jgi:hypothetical protein
MLWMGLDVCQAPVTSKVGLMGDDREERNRVFGMPLGADPHARQGVEQQRVLGVPLDWYRTVNREPLQWLLHPVHQYKRWVQHRRLGPYAPDEDEPSNWRTSRAI